jgi:hypothetical protein
MGGVRLSGFASLYPTYQLFQINGAKLLLTRPTNFNQEKEIQALIEKNLERYCR